MFQVSALHMYPQAVKLSCEDTCTTRNGRAFTLLAFFFLLHEKVTGQDTEVLFSRGELFSFWF